MTAPWAQTVVRAAAARVVAPVVASDPRAAEAVQVAAAARAALAFPDAPVAAAVSESAATAAASVRQSCWAWSAEAVSTGLAVDRVCPCAERQRALTSRLRVAPPCCLTPEEWPAAAAPYGAARPAAVLPASGDARAVGSDPVPRCEVEWWAAQIVPVLALPPTGRRQAAVRAKVRRPPARSLRPQVAAVGAVPLPLRPELGLRQPVSVRARAAGAAERGPAAPELQKPAAQRQLELARGAGEQVRQELRQGAPLASPS